MTYNKWYSKIKEHLSDYKRNVLGIEEDGIWLGNKQKYSHILPLDYAEMNYLCDAARAALKEDEKHQDWYHLNSSQTLCVNFFAPLQNSKSLSTFLSKLIGKEVIVTDSRFEYVPVQNSTNFDFYIQDNNGNNYYFEIKYTEKGVTTNGGGSDPSSSYEQYYKNDVSNNPFFKNVTENMFMKKHFQAYRNMVKGFNNNYSIFITMMSNNATYREIQEAINDLGVDELPFVKIVYWEDLIPETIDLFKDNKQLLTYYHHLKEKYIIK